MRVRYAHGRTSASVLIDLLDGIMAERVRRHKDRTG
jgi:hypothetical protein